MRLSSQTFLRFHHVKVTQNKLILFEFQWIKIDVSLPTVEVFEFAAWGCVSPIIQFVVSVKKFMTSNCSREKSNEFCVFFSDWKDLGLSCLYLNYNYIYMLYINKLNVRYHRNVFLVQLYKTSMKTLLWVSTAICRKTNQWRDKIDIAPRTRWRSWTFL